MIFCTFSCHFIFMVYFQYIDNFHRSDEWNKYLNYKLSVSNLGRADIRPVDGETRAEVEKFLGGLWNAGLAGELTAAALQVHTLQHGPQGGVLLLPGLQLPSKIRSGTQRLRLFLWRGSYISISLSRCHKNLKSVTCHFKDVKTAWLK